MLALLDRLRLSAVRLFVEEEEEDAEEDVERAEEEATGF